MKGKCPACGGETWIEMLNEFAAAAPEHCEECGWWEKDGWYYPSFSEAVKDSFTRFWNVWKSFLQGDICRTKRHYNHF
jgi:hypothetical protein